MHFPLFDKNNTIFNASSLQKHQDLAPNDTMHPKNLLVCHVMCSISQVLGITVIQYNLNTAKEPG